MSAIIEWSPHDAFPEMTCTCSNCLHVFSSHAAFITDQGLVSRKPCPKCGGHKLNRASSEPKSLTNE